LLLFSHWNGCIQFLLASIEGFPSDCWVVRAAIEEKSPFVQWSWSFYHANCQMLSIATGAVSPVRDLEVWTYLISMMLGAIMYAVFVASLTSLISEANASGRAYQTKLDMVNQYIAHTKLPTRLKVKIHEYIELCFPKHKAFDEAQILAEITKPLREEVCMHKCQDILAKLHLVDACEPGLKGSLSQALDRVVFLEGDFIIIEGDVAECMYFITTGKVAVVRLAEETPVTTLGPGSFFGEVAMLSENKRAITSVIVKENVEGYSLSYPDFVRLSLTYPSFREWLEAVVRLRLGRTAAGRNLAAESSSDDLNSRSDYLKKANCNVRINLQALIDANDAETPSGKAQCEKKSPPPQRRGTRRQSLWRGGMGKSRSTVGDRVKPHPSPEASPEQPATVVAAASQKVSFSAGDVAGNQGDGTPKGGSGMLSPRGTNGDDSTPVEKMPPPEPSMEPETVTPPPSPPYWHVAG